VGRDGTGAHLTMGLHITTASIPGRGRTQSDDAFSHRLHNGIHIAAVADGIGSVQAGGEAAARATRRFVDNFETRPTGWTVERTLLEFASQINQQLCEEAVHRYGAEGALACTIAAVAISGDMMWGVNLGDTEVFLLRGGELRALSERHSMSGPEQSHVLTRGLGLEPAVMPHLFSWRVVAGDRVLICTDGVTGHLPREKLAGFLGRHANAAAIVQAIQEPDDDATALVIEISTPPVPADTRPITGLTVPEKLEAGQEWSGQSCSSPSIPLRASGWRAASAMEPNACSSSRRPMRDTTSGSALCSVARSPRRDASNLPSSPGRKSRRVTRFVATASIILMPPRSANA
jgi:serine/threonine protein phosphatase PrpC